MEKTAKARISWTFVGNTIKAIFPDNSTMTFNLEELDSNFLTYPELTRNSSAFGYERKIANSAVSEKTAEKKKPLMQAEFDRLAKDKTWNTRGESKAAKSREEKAALQAEADRANALVKQLLATSNKQQLATFVKANVITQEMMDMELTSREVKK